ncbi:MAG TPA: hypothetical protein PK152_03850 [Anaerolineales bacterium]|jgi:hypothetical protein|nr:hypothetical protein [Anaerolineae bacterium]HRJ55358.1 hypothetical protein [Anaerolineales bacterium]HRK88247.1 hypothetical protein [Anaerolineales bacterium]
MSFSQALEVVIGLVFIYYVLGSIVSLVTQWINEAFETRARSLEKHLMRIVGDKQVGDFVKLPQIESLRPIRYKNMFSFITSATEPKKVEKIPVSTLVDSYFDFVGLTATKEVNADGLKELINILPDSETKGAVIKWIDQGVTNIEDLRKRTTTYFTGVMEQASATFKSNARSFVIVLSIFLTILLGTDSIQLVRTLWTNAGVRALAVAQAEMAVQQEGADVELEDLVQQLSDLNIVRVGWWQTELPPAGSDAMQWAGFVLLKVLGLGLTVAAVSQGSSFWYDLLKKLVSPSKGGGGGGDTGESKG